jgi:hypothetical protein
MEVIKGFQKKKDLMCMNERDVNGKKINKLLFGPNESKTHRRIDINYAPCTPI